MGKTRSLTYYNLTETEARSKGVGTLVQPYGTTRVPCSVRLAEKRPKNRMKKNPVSDDSFEYYYALLARHSF